MGDTLGEIDLGLKLFNEILPTAAGIASAVDPALAPILGPAQLILSAVGKEIDVASKDESAGKSLEQIINDIISFFPSQQPQTGSAT